MLPPPPFLQLLPSHWGGGGEKNQRFWQFSNMPMRVAPFNSDAPHAEATGEKESAGVGERKEACGKRGECARGAAAWAEEERLQDGCCIWRWGGVGNGGLWRAEASWRRRLRAPPPPQSTEVGAPQDRENKGGGGQARAGKAYSGGRGVKKGSLSLRRGGHLCAPGRPGRARERKDSSSSSSS